MTKQNKVVSGIVAGALAIATTVALLTNTTASLQKIDLNIDDAYVNQHSKDDFGKLVDGDIKTRFTLWNPMVTPYTITFPFYDYDTVGVKQIKFRYNNGNLSNLKFYYTRKTDGQRVLIGSYAGGGWDSAWKVIDFPNATAARAFVIESKGGDDFPDDIELYGNFIKATYTPIKQTTPTSDLFGVVVKPWDIAADYIFPDKLKSLQDLGISRIRLYNDYELCHDANGNLIENAYNWHQATNMALLKSKGISTQMCYLSLPANYPWPPVGDSSDPATYLKLAKDIYQFGIWNKNGGEYAKWIELLNEQNCWYCSNKKLYFNGYALAAMCSMAYDGHKGKYPGVGLKASGSAALFSIGGLAEAEPYLLYQIMEWSEKNRGYRADGSIDLPFDIYSFHLYSGLSGQREGTPGGIPPEYNVWQSMKKLQKVRDRFFPWLKIHIGEWGWDVNANSPLNAPAFGRYTAHQTSAMWTVRDLICAASSGINATSYYRIKQDYDDWRSDSNGTTFETMALLREYGTAVKQTDGSYANIDLRRTLTGDYFKQLSTLLNGYQFDSVVSTSPNVVRFKKDSLFLYAIWTTEKMTISPDSRVRPTFAETTAPYSLGKDGTAFTFKDDSSGTMSFYKYVSNTSISANSKPVFVVTGTAVVTPVPIPIPPPPPVIVKKGYYDYAGKRTYFIMYDSKTNSGTYIKTNAKYQPLQ